MTTEDLLRARLHEIDEIQPPEPEDFELRTLDAGRQRMRRRQSWTRGLMGAAAAVAIGALVLPAMGRNASSGGSASSAVAGSAQAPNGLTAGPERYPLPEKSGPTSLPPTGSAPFDFDSTEGAVAVQRLSGILSQPPYSAHFTSLSFDDSTYPPTRLLVKVTDFDPGVMAAVTAAFPPGTPISYAQAPYSSAACQATLARVASDRPTLARQGLAIGYTGCNFDGRVRLELAAPPSPQQTDQLRARYGDTVAVAVASSPSPS